MQIEGLQYEEMILTVKKFIEPLWEAIQKEEIFLVTGCQNRTIYKEIRNE